RTYREQNLNGGFGNAVHGDRRPRLDRRFSWLQRARGWVLIMRIVNLNNPSYRYPEKFSVSQITAARRRGPRIDARKEIPMQDNPVALVTGANKGIGLQIAKDLAARGFTVLVGSRNLEHGETAAKSVGADARALELGVTDQAAI